MAYPVGRTTLCHHITYGLKKTCSWALSNTFSITAISVSLLATRYLYLQNQLGTSYEPLSKDLNIPSSELAAYRDCETECKQLAAEKTWEVLTPEQMLLLKTAQLALCRCQPIIDRLFVKLEGVIRNVAQRMGATHPEEFSAIHDLSFKVTGILPNKKLVVEKDLVYSLNGWDTIYTQRQIQGVIAHEIAHGLLNHSVLWLDYACSPGGKMQIPVSSKVFSEILTTLNSGFQALPKTESAKQLLKNIFTSLDIETLPPLQREKNRLASQIMNQLVSGLICSTQGKIQISPGDAPEIVTTLDSSFNTLPKTKTAQQILEKILISFGVNDLPHLPLARMQLAGKITDELKTMNRFRVREREFEADALTMKQNELAIGLWEYLQQILNHHHVHFFDFDSHPSIVERLHRLTKAICRADPKNEKFCALDKTNYPFTAP